MTNYREWKLFFLAATGASALIVLANPYRGAASAFAAAGILLAVQGLYWLIARPTLAGVRANSARAVLYTVVAIGGLLAATWLNAWSNVILFVLSPQFFILLGPRAATVAIAAANLLAFGLRILSGDVRPAELGEAFGVTALVIVGSVFLSSRMTSIADESAARGALIEQLRRSQGQLAVLSEEQGAAAERERIAREMHDTLAQGFTSILTLGRAVQGELDADPALARRHVELITETAQENLQESRRIIAALTPARLDEATLAQAIERVAARLGDELDVPVDFSVRGSARVAPPALEVVALRVAQESLANIRKHARPANVTVTLDYSENAFSLSVGDDGVGYDETVPAEGYGLRGMRARVAEVGGRIAMASAPGRGTLVRVELPLLEER
ncbi:sensor histidine kinase [Microbacteriaceae bacterium VKM Ac-2854]|nr:sensor histidine kinase [Microbacteriaceae bacterium VKM Ac-2854]